MLKYIALSNWIKDQISVGKLIPGSKLYSEAQLCEMFSVSRNTVRQALNQLEAEHYLHRIQGSGTYVAETVSSKELSSSKNIGVIMTYANDYIFPYIVSSITSKLAEYGYSTTLYTTLNRRDLEKQILDTILSSQLDGLIINPTKSALPNPLHELYERIAERIPCLFINCYYPDLKFSHISPNNVDAMRVGTDYLIKCGHTKIAGIFKSDDLQGHLRYTGFLRSMKTHSLLPNDSNIVWYTTESFPFLFDGAFGSYILERLQNCTAVVCYNDEVAIQLISFLEKHHLHVPDDLSIMSFDDAPICRPQFPLTTVAHPKETLGIRAAESILKLIETPSLDVTYEFPPTLIERNSVRNLLGTSTPTSNAD